MSTEIKGSFLKKNNNYNVISKIDNFKYGYHKLDITPLPLFHTSGYGIESKQSLGCWTKLYAHSIYIATNDTQCVLVSIDFWSVSSGLLNKVIDILHNKYNIGIYEHEIVISATHTHASPGNIASNNFFNHFASNTHGFDNEYFMNLANKISLCIFKAYKNTHDTNVYISHSYLFKFMKNRSLAPFMCNKNAQNIIDDNKELFYNHGHDNSDKINIIEIHNNELAICPKISKLLFYVNESLQNILIFISVHPIATGINNNLYNSDVFGVASVEIIKELKNNTKYDKLNINKDKINVTFFQGAVGDVTINTVKYNRQVCIKFGKILAKHVLNNLININDKNTKKLKPSLKIIYQSAKMNDNSFNFFGVKKTSDIPSNGFAQIGGSQEDAPTYLNKLGWSGGKIAKYKLNNEQGVKREILDIFNFFPKLSYWIKNIYLKYHKLYPPRSFMMNLIMLDDILLCPIPGELTTYNYYKLHDLFNGTNIKDIILLGLSNEYISYFATYEEYNLQHYEGSSTIWGQHSTDYLLYLIHKLYKMNERYKCTHIIDIHANNKLGLCKNKCVVNYSYKNIGKGVNRNIKYNLNELDIIIKSKSSILNNKYARTYIVSNDDDYPTCFVKLFNGEVIGSSDDSYDFIFLLMKNNNEKLWLVLYHISDDVYNKILYDDLALKFEHNNMYNVIDKYNIVCYEKLFKKHDVLHHKNKIKLFKLVKLIKLALTWNKNIAKIIMALGALIIVKKMWKYIYVINSLLCRLLKTII